MGTIAHGNRFPEECFPVHSLRVVLQSHGVGNNLKAIFQRAIRLDVDIFLMHIGNAFESCGIVVIFAAFIDFQFYAKVSLSVSVKDR